MLLLLISLRKKNKWRSKPIRRRNKNYAKAASLWIQGQNRKNASVLTNMDSGWNNARLPFQEVKLSLKDKNFVINYKKSRDGKFQFSDSSMSTIYDWQDDFIDVEISDLDLDQKYPLKIIFY